MKTKEEINKGFEQIISKYDFNVIRIKNKYNHCYRVASICEYLAKELNIDSNLAYIIGLLHDIGKFEQITKYMDNDDLKEFDHGGLGKNIVEENLHFFIDDYDNKNVLISSIEQHNKYKPNVVNEKERMYINLVRDADKIDIFYELEAGIIGIYNNQYTGDINKKILNSINNNEYIHSIKSEDYNNNENLCIMSSYIFDIRYKESFKYLYERKYMDNIFNHINIIEDAKNIYDNIRKIINGFIMENMI